MAVSLQTRSSGRRGKRESTRMMADINVTPFVDVMLVLLIVFMVTAPLLTVGVQVDLPKADAQAIPGNDEPLTISVNAEGKIFVQETETALDALGSRLTAITGSNPDARIFVRGDQAINYGRVMEVMSTVNRAGYRKVALVAESPRETPKAAGRAKRP